MKMGNSAASRFHPYLFRCRTGMWIKMAKKIAVGSEDFIALRKTDSYYVDKTEMLLDLIEANNSVSLFTRPRRFGKTLTMSMLESFFSIFKKEDALEAFSGLKIMSYSSFCQEWMNQYPTLFVSLKDVDSLSFKNAYERLKTVIADVCKKLSFLERSEKINTYDLTLFKKLQNQTSTEADLQNSLKTIMRMMYAVFHKPVILLIDEYDVPLAKAYSNGYYNEMLEMIRGFMSSSLKTNEYLKFAVVTGCLRIPKESIFTGVNNFSSYSVLDNRFSKYFGFTHDEVEKILAYYHLQDKVELIKNWYDGYIFGNSKVYCPWDVVNYLSALLYDKTSKPRNYWENTSGNDAIKAFFDLGSVDVSDKFETLLNGGTIFENVTNALSYEKVYESEQNLWSILLMTGYITTVQQNGVINNPDAENENQLELRIPNKEISGIFQSAVVDHFKQSIDKAKLNSLMNALWNGDEKAASGFLSDMLWSTISYMDYHEDYYHAFLTGLFVGRGGYSVRSNKERGLGRPDVDLRDKRNRRAIIIETKKSKRKQDMEQDCLDAIRQIQEKEYAKHLDGYNQIFCYGISFYQKSALVKKSNT